MSQPFRHTSIEEATGTAAGTPELTKGHNSIGLAVHASNLDKSNDDLIVRLQARIDGEWVPINVSDPLTEAELVDVNGNGVYGAVTYVHGLAVEAVRAAIVEYADNAGNDLTVNAYVLGCNNSGSGRDYRQG